MPRFSRAFPSVRTALYEAFEADSIPEADAKRVVTEAVDEPIDLGPVNDPAEASVGARAMVKAAGSLIGRLAQE